MKKIVISAMLVFGIAYGAGAQDLKFGHINSQDLVALMPERDSALINLQTYQKELEETIRGMEDEYNAKYTEYQRKSETWTPVIRESKEKDLQDLVQRIQQFQQTAQQEMQMMQQQQFAPVFKKAQDAIEKVAKDNGLVFVFDSSSLLYKDDAKSFDLLPAAKAALGIPAAKVAPTQIPPVGGEAAAAAPAAK